MNLGVVVLAFELSGSKKKKEKVCGKSSQERTGVWLPLLAFLNNLNHAHTLNMCSHPLSLFLPTYTSHLTTRYALSHKVSAAKGLHAIYQRCKTNGRGFFVINGEGSVLKGKKIQEGCFEFYEEKIIRHEV